MRLSAIGLMVALMLLGPTSEALAQVGPPSRCDADASFVSAAAVVQSRALPHFIEVELTLVNKTRGTIRLDPARFALVSDQGERVTPVSPDQVIYALRSPAPVYVGVFGFFSFGSVGVAVGVGPLDLRARTIEARMLKAVDLVPGATVMGSVYFRPAAWPEQFRLILDGLAVESGAGLPPVELRSCRMPVRPGEPPAAFNPLPAAMRTVQVSARGDAGPIVVSVSGVEFARDATTLTVTVENAAGVDADLFTALGETRLVDNTGKSYALRMLRSDLPDRVAARSQSQGRLEFVPLPAPPAITAAILTMSSIRIGDAVHEIKVEMRF